jgi:hypothetical protein
MKPNKRHNKEDIILVVVVIVRKEDCFLGHGLATWYKLECAHERLKQNLTVPVGKSF